MTLVRLFEIHCDKGRQHVACIQADSSFTCGCHDNWKTTDIVADWYDDKVSKGSDDRQELKKDVKDAGELER